MDEPFTRQIHRCGFTLEFPGGSDTRDDAQEKLHQLDVIAPNILSTRSRVDCARSRTQHIVVAASRVEARAASIYSTSNDLRASSVSELSNATETFSFRSSIFGRAAAKTRRPGVFAHAASRSRRKYGLDPLWSDIRHD